MVPFDAPVLLVRTDPAGESLTEAMTQLFRIGWTQIIGYLEGGFESWGSGGRTTSSNEMVSADDLCEASRSG